MPKDRDHPSAHPHIPATAHHIMLVALTLTVLGHGQQLPVIITISCLTMILWRFLIFRSAWPQPGKWLQALFGLTGLAGIWAGFGSFIGPEAGTALLALMLALKTLEIRAQRDLWVVGIIGIFLSVIQILFQPGPISLAYITGTLWLYFLAIFLLNSEIPMTTGDTVKTSPRQAQPRQAWRTLIPAARSTAAIMIQAIPLMVILFYLFPRLPGPLWSIPRQSQGSGMTGLDDRMSPGNISHLTQSNAIAFRVHFDGDIPDNRTLYWRGPVLWYTDGRLWNSGPDSDLNSRADNIRFSGPAIHYQVALEPHNRRWLYALDLPATDTANGHRTHDLLIVSDQAVQQRRHYTVTSFSQYRMPPISQKDRRRGLQLPEQGSQSARALARQWRQKATTDRAVIDQALRYFHDQNFYYTLQPPRLDQDPIDEFLFQTRKGFCEHYASAFTLLMRAAGIPARVVTGYQGGEINTVGHYLIVRQRDAHAWSEVWLANEGWVRIDPTAAVAPSRIENGIDSIMDDGLISARDRQQNGLSQLWRKARYSWDALGTRWDSWVTHFDHNGQASLFDRLGIESPATLALYLALGLGLALGLLVLLLRHKAHRQIDPVIRAYRKFCHKMARQGVTRGDAEGADSFSARIQRLRPDLSTQARAICTDYIQLRYAHPNDHVRQKRLQRRVRAFRPGHPRRVTL